MKTLITIDRISAWGLFFSMLLYFISGYGMTKGIISRDFALKLHLSYLTYFVLIFFIVHTSFAIHLALKRWRIWNGYSKTGLIILYLVFIGSFFYVDKFYQPKITTTDQSVGSSDSQAVVDQSDSAQSSTSNTTSSDQKIFSQTELAMFNGLDGQPAYLAVDGIVYDLSAVFKSGSHYSHFAGQELTNSFYSYHVKSSITKYPVVGVLK